MISHQQTSTLIFLVSIDIHSSDAFTLIAFSIFAAFFFPVENFLPFDSSVLCATEEYERVCKIGYPLIINVELKYGMRISHKILQDII